MPLAAHSSPLELARAQVDFQLPQPVSVYLKVSLFVFKNLAKTAESFTVYVCVHTYTGRWKSKMLRNCTSGSWPQPVTLALGV